MKKDITDIAEIVADDFISNHTEEEQIDFVAAILTALERTRFIVDENSTYNCKHPNIAVQKILRILNEYNIYDYSTQNFFYDK